MGMIEMCNSSLSENGVETEKKEPKLESLLGFIL